MLGRRLFAALPAAGGCGRREGIVEGAHGVHACFLVVAFVLALVVENYAVRRVWVDGINVVTAT